MPRTVLLADDSVTAQNMGRRILMDAGYEVITVNNGSAALKKIHEAHPDLIVLDVYMPGYGGLEVCQRLKESGETMRIPVLLTVGKMEPFKADEAKRVRADAHIVKPFEASELLAAMAKLEDRIVPQADSSRGRKSKKPSFWHDDEPTPAEEPMPAEPPKVGAFPQVPEASGELPVLAESAAYSAADEGSAQVAESTPAETVESGGARGSHAEAEEPKAGTEPGPWEISEVPQNEGVSAQPSVETSKQASSPPAEAEAKSSTPSVGRWVAENVTLTPEEAALELEQEMRVAETASPALAAEQPAVPDTRGATFAAAAGASGSVTAMAGVTREEADTPVASEAAAAWENWQHIRDTVMNAHNTSAIAEHVAQAAKASIQDAAPQAATTDAAPVTSMPQPSSEAPAPSELEAGALAGIVDSVLAELKPKLMEEIAKKLKK